MRDAVGGLLTSKVLDHVLMRPINGVRASQGLPVLAHYRDVLLQPSLLLVLTAEGFEYPRSDWPANVRLVGPINWASRQAPPAWLADAADPVVLVACSTERQADERLVAVALEALPPAGICVIATTAAHDPRAFSAPPGSKVVRFLPHEAILERAACVVCHGGMGITQKALAAEVPVVVVPFGRDQYETARRVEVADAGVRLPRRHLTPDGLVDAVRCAIALRVGAQRVSRAYAAAGGQVAATDAIEALGQRQCQSSAESACTGPVCR
ncbi:MAG: glycosyltransferase [Solirubrobacterales bacterium]